MNRFVGMGRLTAEPNLKYSATKTDMAICRYTLAINRPKKQGQEKADVDFINCIAFGKAGEFASKYFHKGQRVLVEGRVQIDQSEKDGKKIYYTNIIVASQEFADAPKQGKVENNNNDDAMAGFEDIQDDTMDEIPF